MLAKKKQRAARLFEHTPWLILAVACAVALFHGLRAVRHTDWPYDLDQYRDVGIAQSILDGEFPRDYLYAGEYLTYPPLTGACIAATAWLGHIPAPKADVLLGPFLNLLAPLLFFLLAKALFGRWCAMAAVIAFFFNMPHGDYGWVRATYSPWLFAPLLAQSLFYGALLAYLRGLQTRRWRWHAVFGLCGGLAFLAHPAPVLLLVPITACTTVWLYASIQRQARHAWLAGECGRLALAAAMAALAASPLLYILLARYGFHTLNSAPSQWVYEPLSLDKAPMLLARAWSITGVGAMAGVWAIACMRTRAPARRILLSWMGCAGAFLLYSYASQYAAQRGMHWPSFVPSYHYYLYFTGASALCFGCGMAYLFRKIRSVAAGNSQYRFGNNGVNRIVFTLAMAALAGFWLRDYPRWHDLSAAPHYAYALHAAYPGAYEWVMRHAAPSDIFLCNDRTGMAISAPAGRKVAAAPALFTGQFVNHAACAQDRDELLLALVTGETERFFTLARKRKISFVALTKEEYERMSACAASWLSLEFDSVPLRIYRVHEKLGN